MRNLLILMVVGLMAVFSVKCLAAGQDYGPKVAIKQAKARQKDERKALKLKRKSLKQYWKSQRVPKAIKLQMMHQADREWRELREKQRSELQDLKDRQRVVKESQKAYSQRRL
jgi:hypothetical protein